MNSIILVLYTTFPQLYWLWWWWWWQVITSCNNTKDELMQEVLNLNRRRIDVPQEHDNSKEQEANRDPPFQYLNHVRTYPTFMFAGVEGSRVATVAFLRKWKSVSCSVMVGCILGFVLLWVDLGVWCHFFVCYFHHVTCYFTCIINKKIEKITNSHHEYFNY